MEFWGADGGEEGRSVTEQNQQGRAVKLVLCPSHL